MNRDTWEGFEAGASAEESVVPFGNKDAGRVWMKAREDGVEDG